MYSLLVDDTESQMDYWQHDLREFLLSARVTGSLPPISKPHSYYLLLLCFDPNCLQLVFSKYFPNSTSSDFSIIFSKPVYLQAFGFYSISRHESTCRRVNKNLEFYIFSNKNCSLKN